MRTSLTIIHLTLLTAITAQAQAQAQAQTTSLSNPSHSSQSQSKSPTAPHPHFGPIDDATCNVEQLEEANDSQLFTILHDLVDTAFFRNFAVDLETKCPLSWDRDRDRDRDRKTKAEDEDEAVPTTKETNKKDDNTSSDNGNDNDNDNPYAEPEGGCASEGLPDADEEDEDSVPACHVDLGANDFMGGMGMGMGGGMSGMSSAPPPPTPPLPPPVEEQMDEAVEEKVEDVKVEPDEEEEEEESEFDCDGGSISDEVEDDAPPLCQLTHSEMTTLGMGFEDSTTSSSSSAISSSKTPLQDLLSSALNSVNEKMGWESDSEKKTFIWNRSTNPIVRVGGDDGEPCDDSAETGRLPDSFWIDMCSRISEGEGLQMVDLSLNPERNTGYNGTHIWQSIYEENCIDIDMKNDIEMCYEERVLYRLLSGLHASTTLSIGMNYYPPNKKKNRLTWTPNPKFFWSKFGSHSGHPEYIRNLHFSYVVLLRALKKAEPILSRYEIRTGNIIEDETAMVLLRRLLDSSILKSCSNVFEAFDESLMFRGNITDADDSAIDADGNVDIDIDTDTDPDLEQDPAFKFPNGRAQKHPEELITLQQNFKMVFHNISSILDCVQCQQCKLHGKMAMLGYGTALKILFMSDAGIEAAAANINIGTGVESSLTRNEIVALINTVAKFSESLREVRELTHLYWSGDDHDNSGSTPTPGLPSPSLTSSPLDMAMGAVNALSTAGAIAPEREEELIHLALAGDEALLTLAKHYGNDLEKFLSFSTDIGELGRVVVVDDTPPDAIVIGTGLAGLAATLNILDRGGRVLVVEKEHNVGGNSNKASSGINACDNVTAVSITDNDNSDDDYLGSFIGDTTKSAGNAARPELIEQLVGNSWEAVSWLKDRVGVDLSLKAQLGGHQYKRTHRPKNGMVGAEIIYGVQKAVKEYEKQGKVKIMTDTKVVGLLRGESGNVTGVQVQYLLDDANLEDRPTDLTSPHVILATGGFAADRSEGSLLSQYRPELISMPATAGPYSTGDGIGLATTVGAGVTDMDKVQVHPTGWVDPTDPHNPNKVLAGELMRGVGGILMNKMGKRFCNELGTRAYVTDKMLSHDPYHAEHGVWKKESELQTFALVLSSSAAADGKKHVDHYIHKGLMNRLEGVTELAEWMGQDVDVEVIRDTLTQYRADAENGVDEWGKTSFQGTPDINLDTEVFYAGTVTPVLHYCMGGLTIDKDGNVLDDSTGLPISGLHAAGEVTGGVHGNNRLGGNSLLECTVYGTIVGKKIPIQPRALSISNIAKLSKVPIPKKEMAQISLSEVAKHNTEDDCWVAIHGKVYDLTDFAESHPPGAISIHKLAGIDGTEAFQSIHNEGMLEDFEDDLIGVLVG